MEIISLDAQTLSKVVRVLRRGGVILYPTETAYGLGCDATNTAAVRRIFVIKDRSIKKALPLIVGSRAMAERYVRLSPRLKQLAKRYWPGPFTIVAPRRISNFRFQISNLVSSGSVGVRVSASPFARALSQRLGHPIVATSANRAGGKECYALLDVLRQFHGRHLPDLCIDGERLSRRKPSTVVTERRGKIIILRQGPINVPSFARKDSSAV